MEPSELPPGKTMAVGKFSDGDFMALPQNAAGIDELPGETRIIMQLNRYRNILPNKKTRVRLHQKGKDPITTYINANFVVNAYGNPNGYIASQGPTPNTSDDFWRMVWEQGTTAIVMITGLVEKGREKCFRYWPEDTTAPVEHGEFRIEASKVAPLGDYTETSITLTHKKSGETRQVHHFWYTAWPDHGVPTNTEGAADMLAAVREYSSDADQPWVVHCSAGVGRTGTFIGIDTGIHLLNANGEVDVLTLVNQMRSCRGQMVQSPYQARFVYTVLRDYADKFNRQNQDPLALLEEQNDPTIITARDIGKRVDTDDYGQAILRFVGPNVQTYHMMVGVELEYSPDGVECTDGMLKGHRYFTCKDERGLFLPLAAVSKTDELDYPDSDRESVASFEDLMLAAGTVNDAAEEDLDMVIRNPIWLHHMLPRPMCEALLHDANLAPGTFLVKRRHEENTFEISVVGSDEQITFHKIKRSAISGGLQVTVTGSTWTDFDDCANLNDLIRTLASTDERWSIPLTAYVPRGRVPGDGSQAAAPYVKTRRRGSDQLNESAVSGGADGSKQFPLWSIDLARSQAELLLSYTGTENGAWLLRRLPGDSVGLSVLYQGSASHHLLEFNDGVTSLNRQPVGNIPLAVVLDTLQSQPSVYGWPFMLEADKFVTPWKVGDLVSAPYSVNGRYYDCIVVDIIATGSFEDIPVDLARVSYVGYASDNDDCVPLPGLKPSTGRENPDFYHAGDLTTAHILSKHGLEETNEDRNRRLESLHLEASLRPRVVELSKSEEVGYGVDLQGSTAGVFIVRSTGVAAATRRIQAGMRLLAVGGVDITGVEQAQELLSNGNQCELTVKSDHEGYQLVVQELEQAKQQALAQQEAVYQRLVDDGLKRVRIVGVGTVGLVLKTAEGAGNFVVDLRPDGLAKKANADVIGLKLVQVDNEHVSTVGKADVMATIKRLKTSNKPLNLFFARDDDTFRALTASIEPASTTPVVETTSTTATNPVFNGTPTSATPRTGTSRVSMSSVDGFDPKDVGSRVIVKTKVVNAVSPFQQQYMLVAILMKKYYLTPPVN